MYNYLKKDLSKCELCEWRCKVDRLNNEKGVCEITIPKVAVSMLHPAPPPSFDAFLTGCNFRCLFCQNWEIANYPKNPRAKNIEGYFDPCLWAKIGVKSLSSIKAKIIGADRLFFTGGEPTCSLPWVEEVAKVARKIEPKTKVNFDTNGYLTLKSLKRVLKFVDSITYDIKAYNEKIFSALTGANVEPVLRNAEYIAKNAKEKLWEFRIIVIPKINEKDVENICEFIFNMEPTLPICFLAFRPNFVMEKHMGASLPLMEKYVEIAEKIGLKNVSWGGYTGIKGKIKENILQRMKKLKGREEVRLACAYALEHGCIKTERNCKECILMENCRIKRYVAKTRN